ncbi:MAG: hypothetical protein H0T42_11160 [Deltaproteobacteria bacterium]|nr:hypothetical protein [Deltaproteobacteria bacterium]
MLRWVVLLPLLVACDLALGLDSRVRNVVCGPYAEPTLVPFHDELVDAKDFSVDSSGLRGMIHAKFTGTQTRTGVHTIKFVDPVWRLDPERDNGILPNLDGAHISESNMAVGWVTRKSLVQPSMHEYTFSTVSTPPQWGGGGGFAIDTVQADTSIAGNVVELPFGGSMIRFVVSVRVPEAGTSSIRIFQLVPGKPTWELTGRADLLQFANEKLNPNGVVTTADHSKLVYSATLGTSTISRLFSTRSVDQRFDHGPELIIDGVEDEEDLREPWINADCSVLYFRRGDATWMATAVDAPASEP